MLASNLSTSSWAMSARVSAVSSSAWAAWQCSFSRSESSEQSMIYVCGYPLPPRTPRSATAACLLAESLSSARCTRDLGSPGFELIQHTSSSLIRLCLHACHHSAPMQQQDCKQSVPYRCSLLYFTGLSIFPPYCVQLCLPMGLFAQFNTLSLLQLPTAGK